MSRSDLKNKSTSRNTIIGVLKKLHVKPASLQNRREIKRPKRSEQSIGGTELEYGWKNRGNEPKSDGWRGDYGGCMLELGWKGGCKGGGSRVYKTPREQPARRRESGGRQLRREQKKK